MLTLRAPRPLAPTGWLTAAHPDPHGCTLAAVRAYLRTAPRASACGLFWDWGSLPQKPRTGLEAACFREVLAVMLLLYASMSGTAVLQKKAIPPRPAAYDGWLVLFDLGEHAATEAALKERLDGLQVGEVQELRLARVDGGSAHVRLATHAQAVDAVAALREQRWCGAGLEWNDRPYDGEGGRGWCIAEQGACMAVAVHVEAAVRQRQGGAGLAPHLARLAASAEGMRPKVIEISEDQPAVAVATTTEAAEEASRGSLTWLTGQRGGVQLAAAMRAIDAAHFTGKGDKATVHMLLAKLEFDIKTALERAFAEHTAGGALTEPPAPLDASACAAGARRLWRLFERTAAGCSRRLDGAQALVAPAGSSRDGAELEAGDVELISRGGRRLWGAGQPSAAVEDV